MLWFRFVVHTFRPVDWTALPYWSLVRTVNLAGHPQRTSAVNSDSSHESGSTTDSGWSHLANRQPAECGVQATNSLRKRFSFPSTLWTENKYKFKFKTAKSVIPSPKKKAFTLNVFLAVRDVMLEVQIWTWEKRRKIRVFSSGIWTVYYFFENIISQKTIKLSRCRQVCPAGLLWWKKMLS